MQKNFNNARNNTPAVTFYDGDIVMDNGEAKIEWFDPIEGFSLQTEEQLVQKENDSRSKLDPNGDKAAWIRHRNINYSAERGLDKIQNHKLQSNIKLKTQARPLVR